MRAKFGFLIVACAMMLAGCSSYTLTNSEVYVGADLSQYSTFRIVTPSDGSLPPGMSMVTYYNIAAAIRDQLYQRGWTEDNNSPVLVNIGLTVKKELTTTPVTQTVPVYGSGVYYPGLAPAPLPRPIAGNPPMPPSYNGMVPYFIYPRAYYFPQYTTYTQWVPTIYREGVLTMDLINTSTMTPLYTSSVATILDNGDSELQTLSGITSAVKVLFSKFPIPLLPQYK